MSLLLLRRSLTRRRSRVVVAVLAVALGATTLFALATLAIDLPRHLSRDLRNYGANLVVVADGDRLDAAALAAVDAALAGAPVVTEAAFRYAPVQVNAQPSTAAGVDLAAAEAAKGYWDVEGAWPTGPGEALVGRDVAEWLDLAVGEAVTLEGAAEDGVAAAVTVTVTGLVSSGGTEDGFVVVGLDDLAEVTGEAGVYDVIELSVAADQAGLADWAERLNAAVPGVRAAAVTRLAHSEADVVAMVRSLLGLVAVLVLALSLIGVATTMMAVVAERRGEIALSKALGAADRAIARQFLVEGLVVGVAGGVVGVGLGFGLAAAISQSVFGRGVGFLGWLAAATVVAAAGVTFVACQVPVRRAALVDPALQLREE